MTNNLNRHFLLTQNDINPVPGNWTKKAFRDWTIYLGESVPFIPVLDSQDRQSGFILGWLATPEKGYSPGDSLSGPSDDETYTDWSRDFCGRFVCVLEDKIYTDAGGQLGVVFNQDLNTVASTPNLVEGALEDQALLQELDIRKKHGWYPSGLVPWQGWQRVLPNFVLDCTRWQMDRIWPLQPLQSSDDTAALMNRVVDRTTALAGNLALAPTTVCTLTAGYDSRMVLAASRPIASTLQYVTIELPFESAQLDAMMAARICRKVNLSHEKRPFLPVKTGQVNEWLERTGYCISDVVTDLVATVGSWPQTEGQLTGACGEVGRAFYWNMSDIGTDRPTARLLLERLGQPASARIIEATEKWLQTIPDFLDIAAFWDLVYIEQRLGCWAGASVYGAKQAVPSLSPFNCRSTYTDLLCLPVAFRGQEQFSPAFIKTAWPALLAFPFNRAPGLLKIRFWKSELKALLPDSLKTVLRKLMGK